MAVAQNQARVKILNEVSTALGRRANETPAPGTRPVLARRVPGETDAEVDLLLLEIRKLGGATRRIDTAARLKEALAELVQTLCVQKASLWDTPDLHSLQVAEHLASLGVEIISPHAGKQRLAECDLGVTGADGAVPASGTLLLRALPDRSRAVSLLPRVHLAIVQHQVLKADLASLLSGVRGESFVLVTGPSRTADIELTQVLGVHGPKALHVWAWDGDPLGQA